MWLADFARIGGLFRSAAFGAVIDAFSRRLLALRVTKGEPTTAFTVRLLREATSGGECPNWMVTDEGTQFT